MYLIARHLLILRVLREILLTERTQETALQPLLNALGMEPMFAVQLRNLFLLLVVVEADRAVLEAALWEVIEMQGLLEEPSLRLASQE